MQLDSWCSKAAGPQRLSIAETGPTTITPEAVWLADDLVWRRDGVDYKAPR